MDPRIRSYSLPVAMVAGMLLHKQMAALYFLTPYAIFAMLFFPFARVSIKDIHPHKMHGVLLLFQLVVSVICYYLLRGFDETIAQGTMMCIFAPAAMASATIGGMLGANVKVMTTFILISNIATAIVTPILFPLIGVHEEMPFFASFWLILKKVASVLLAPLITIWLMEWLTPKAHDFVKRHQDWAFYAWALSLLILMGKTTDNLINEPSHDYATELILGAAGLITCLGQFAFGRWWGKRNGDTVAGGQSLGQKNTTLSIWITLAYLNPVAAVGPTAYIVWQNLVNSYQLWKIRKKKTEI